MKERYQNNQYSLDHSEIVRPFASGSRQAPDPFDFYLDENGFYRKHTARDSSCLFRVVSEQVYGIQNYHERVRQEIVDYMKKNSRLFERAIKDLGQDFDDYLMDMSKPKGYGGRQELRAASLLYKVNVLVFEPYMRGKFLHKQRKNFNRIVRVFFTAPSHYDSVYTKTYIEKAAFCQAVVYEILYEKVFKLPDVKYAIERMLYDQTGKSMENHETETGEPMAVSDDGREFIFDKADDTNCVLGDFKLCHFHNETGFHAEIEKVKAKEESQCLVSEEEAMPKIFPTDYFLYDSKISCVRQLLNAAIAPFPYKVAKALDTSIYRNIEFDSWADWRRELKFKNWYCRGNQLMVGCKCLLRRFDASNGEFYNICTIKDISKDKRDCLVFVEETGETKFVPYASLKPLTGKLEDSYNVHNLSRQFVTYNNKHNQLSIKSYKHQETTFKRDTYSSKYSSLLQCGIEIDRIGDNFRPFVQNIIAMPMFQKTHQNPGGENKPVVVLSGIAKKDSQPIVNTESSPNITFLQETDSLNDVNDLQKILQGNNFVPIRSRNGDISPFEDKNENKNVVVESKINYNAAKSDKADGSDLPTDIATLRFFYNTGVESFKSSKAVGHIALQFSNLTTETTNTPDVSQLAKQFDSKLKTDDNNNTPNTCVATPVTSSNSYQGNSGEYHTRRPLKRRPFHSNSGRGYHNNNNGSYHGGNYRSNLGYHNSRHGNGNGGNNYHQTDYGRHQNNQDNQSFKGTTTPTSVVSQHSSLCPDSGVMTDNSQNGSAEYISQQSSAIDYSNSMNNAVAQPTQQQYPYVTNIYQPQEYDQNNWYSTGVQAPVPCYYPQPNSVPSTPHVVIPTHDVNYSYMYNPHSAPADGSTTPMVEPTYTPYVHPYYLSAPVQPQPMAYFTYYPSPMGYGSGPAPATSPQIQAAPLGSVMSNMSNIQ